MDGFDHGPLAAWRIARAAGAAIGELTNVGCVTRLEPGGPHVFPLDGLVDLLAVNRDLRGSIDTEANLVSPNIHDRYDDIVADHDAFVALSGEHEHR